MDQMVCKEKLFSIIALFNSWSATIFSALSIVPSKLKTVTFSLADKTFDVLLRNTFSALSLNCLSIILTSPVA